MTALRTLVTVLALLAAAPVAAQDVGVAAAVNQSAQSVRPNAVVRTIGLGDNVIHNERIDTNDVGLVQLLLADGTTFTVGPNSSLVIDSFVYDPEAGTAQVAATLTKGVLRFIGAATSKTPDGVAITTPVGVVGIRGGVTDINMNPPNGIPPHISMIFGNAVTLSRGGQLLGRLFEAGYSLALVGGGIDTLKTPAEWASQIQAALSSGPGQTGGSPKGANTAQVNKVANVNSSQTPLEPPIPMPPLVRLEDVADDLAAEAGSDFGHDRGPPGPSLSGYAGGIVTLTDNMNSATPFPIVSLSTGFSTQLANIAFDASGDPVSGELTMVVLGGCVRANCVLQVNFDPTGTTLTGFDQNFNVITTPVSGELLSHDEVTLPGGVNYCQCDFLKWGFWSVDGTVQDPSIHANGHLKVDNGTWVVANDLTTNTELSQLGNVSATYDGHAIGSYADPANAIGPTLTAGDMQLNWSFGNRTGTIEITDFGGRDLTGDLVGAPGLPGFIGDLNDGANATGLTKGSFVNDGSTIAAGVMGDFVIEDGSWSGSGIFMGER